MSSRFATGRAAILRLWLPMLLAAASHARSEWKPSVSTYRGEFHRFSPPVPGRTGGNAAWAMHEVSRNLVEWTDAGVELPGEPTGRVMGACATDDGASTEDGGSADGSHAVLAWVEGVDAGASLCLFRSADGRRYERHAGNPVLRVPGASGAAPSMVWHGPSRRWVVGVPVRDARGAGLLLHGSTNLLEWTGLGRIDGDHDGGGIVELPLRGGKGGKAWVSMNADGRATLGTFEGDAFVPSPLRFAAGRGDPRWEFAPVSGLRMPAGRRLVVGKGPGRDGWDGSLPWEVSLESTGSEFRIFWEPSSEGETLRARSRSFDVPGLGKAGTNELVANLPARFELALDVPNLPQLRMTLRMGGDHIRLFAPERILVLNGTTHVLSPIDGMNRWRIHRVRDRLELVVSEGRFRACVRPSQPDATGPMVLERLNGWWLPFGQILLHELREPPASKNAPSNP